ncbi:ketosteroid isomerase family protein [Kitasatospora sp. NPDC002040]|uniref:ketosteroid isomerase family protein n=1 Tax=Kitasatospora sp. NPDC002040 TaxID=3154661 RepID=UPI0033191BF8
MTKHQVDVIDAQPSPGDGVLIHVTGTFSIDGSADALPFADTVNLLPDPDPDRPGRSYIHNQIRRVVPV